MFKYHFANGFWLRYSILLRSHTFLFSRGFLLFRRLVIWMLNISSKMFFFPAKTDSSPIYSQNLLEQKIKQFENNRFKHVFSLSNTKMKTSGQTQDISTSQKEGAGKFPQEKPVMFELFIIFESLKLLLTIYLCF